MADVKSWNPWHGCFRYSEGCEHCYMYALDRMRHVPEKSSVIKKTKQFYLPIERDRRGRFKIHSGYCFRVNMASDTFIEGAEQWLPDMWRIIHERPDIRFYILTKRAERMATHLPDNWGDGYENVELNITCENQRAFDERWPILKKIPAKHKGMNLAPLIGPIDITPALESGQIETVNIGGESFGGRRPCHYEWVKAVSDACKKYKVNFTFNSTGEVFVKDGRTYNIPNKRIQTIQAYRSHLSCFFGMPKYKLYHPYSHRLLEEKDFEKPLFNANRCLECPAFDTCIGCKDCGTCKDVRLIPYDEIIRLKRERGLT